jgi:hypothetical protein
MEPSPEPRVADAERVSGDVVIEFEDGKCALYSAALLHSMLARAIELATYEFEED